MIGVVQRVRQDVVAEIAAVLRELGPGGLQGLQKINEEKARVLYDAIDSSGGFYSCPVDKDARSRMNVVFRLGSEDLSPQPLPVRGRAVASRTRTKPGA